MPTLKDEVKLFIVQQLAMYDTPSQVAAAVKEEYGIEVSRQAVQVYDPTKGDKPAKKWVDLFTATREKFIDAASDVPIAIRAVRLRRLDRMSIDLERRKNVLGAAALMKQAAEDIGGVYTNRRELTGKNGEPLVPDLTAEERRERVLALLREAAVRRDVAGKDKKQGERSAAKKAKKERAAS